MDNDLNEVVKDITKKYQLLDRKIDEIHNHSKEIIHLERYRTELSEERTRLELIKTGIAFLASGIGSLALLGRDNKYAFISYIAIVLGAVIIICSYIR